MAPEVEEFARLLIEHVRDMAVSELDTTLRPAANDAQAKRWRKKLQTAQASEILTEVIPDCVDDTMFYLLHAIDNGLLNVSFTGSSGNTVDLTQAGRSEMSGWYMMTNGWRQQFSTERFNDDFTDLS